MQSSKKGIVYVSVFHQIYSTNMLLLLVKILNWKKKNNVRSYLNWAGLIYSLKMAIDTKKVNLIDWQFMCTYINQHITPIQNPLCIYCSIKILFKNKNIFIQVFISASLSSNITLSANLFIIKIINSPKILFSSK